MKYVRFWAYVLMVSLSIQWVVQWTGEGLGIPTWIDKDITAFVTGCASGWWFGMVRTRTERYVREQQRRGYYR